MEPSKKISHKIVVIHACEKTPQETAKVFAEAILSILENGEPTECKKKTRKKQSGRSTSELAVESKQKTPKDHQNLKNSDV